MTTKKIGFIGLGTMGRPMVLNLLKAGYDVRVYNRTRSRSDALAAEGASVACSCADVARGSDVIITMLSDSPVVKKAIGGDEGVLQGAAPGAIVVDMSTIAPAAAVEIGVACATNGLRFLDAPVTGGESGAVAGTLSVMVGGDADVLEVARPVLEAMSSRITHMGAVGTGQMAKLCNQVVCGLNILAACEGLALASASGLDMKKLLDAITPGAAGSWMLSNLALKMVDEDWAPGFKIALQQKDLRLALEWAAQSRLPLVGTGVAHQLFRSAEAWGSADEGIQALFKVTMALGGRTTS